MSLGKWIGGIVGFMTLGPLGALAGIVIGSMFDEKDKYVQDGQGQGPYSTQDAYNSHDMGQRDSFLFAMLVMASYIIRADGRVMHSEMEYVRQMLRRNFGEIAVRQGEQILLKLFEEQKRMDQSSPYAFKRTVIDCGRQIASNLSYAERLQLLSFLVEIAKCDGTVCTAEVEALREVTQAVGLNPHEIDSLLNLQGNSLEDAYKVLEVDPNATDDEVRSAYRRMAVKHHPDKVASLGEDIRQAANEKFQRINEAKERIYKARGMK